MASVRHRTATAGEKGLLAIGFFVLSCAIAVAHTSPASGYEVSIYTHTPLPFWILLAIAFLVSLAVALETAATWLRRLALALGGGAALTFVSLPILRGYWFISGGDALTHLGWARGISSGSIDPLELRYPAIHTVSGLLEATVGIELQHAMLLVVLLLFGLFFLFVALSTSLVLESRYSATIGAFSAFLLLPITNLSTSVALHAMSQAILFTAVFVYLLVKYVRTDRSLFTTSALGVLLAITSIALVLYHPQLVAHLLVVLVGICAVQFVYRRYRSAHPIASDRPIYGQTAVLGGVFLIWVVNHDFIADVIEFHLVSTLEYFLTGDGSAGTSVGAQADSLVAIGGSLLEVVLKLLGPQLVFGALAAILVVWVVVGGERLDRWMTRSVVHYFTVGLLGLTVLFGVYFFGSTGEMYFRVFGLMMLFVTIMGAVVVAHGVTVLSQKWSTVSVHSLVAVGLGILLVVSLLAAFPSPYIYDSSPHVTEQSMSSHELVLERSAEDVAFDGIRAGPNRYADATDPDLDRTQVHGSVSGEEIDEGVAAQYDDSRYITASQQDRDREVVAYKELRYTEDQLASISEQPGVNRIQSTGELEVYYVSGSEGG